MTFHLILTGSFIALTLYLWRKCAVAQHQRDLALVKKMYERFGKWESSDWDDWGDE